MPRAARLRWVSSSRRTTAQSRCARMGGAERLTNRHPHRMAAKSAQCMELGEGLAQTPHAVLGLCGTQGLLARGRAAAALAGARSGRARRESGDELRGRRRARRSRRAAPSARRRRQRTRRARRRRPPAPACAAAARRQQSTAMRSCGRSARRRCLFRLKPRSAPWRRLRRASAARAWKAGSRRRAQALACRLRAVHRESNAADASPALGFRSAFPAACAPPRRWTSPASSSSAVAGASRESQLSASAFAAAAGARTRSTRPRARAAARLARGAPRSPQMRHRAYPAARRRPTKLFASIKAVGSVARRPTAPSARLWRPRSAWDWPATRCGAPSCATSGLLRPVGWHARQRAKPRFLRLMRSQRRHAAACAPSASAPPRCAW